jgi:hypothetical protein
LPEAKAICVPELPENDISLNDDKKARFSPRNPQKIRVRV